MSPAKPDPHALVTGLANECNSWHALLGILREEEQALINGAADHLALLNSHKLQQLEQLSTLARTRRAQLLSLGRTPDHSGMESWLTQHGAPQDHECWQQLCEAEHMASVQNQRIGTLIDLRLAATRQALNVLTLCAAGQGSLYDQAGLAVNPRGGRSVTAA